MVVVLIDDILLKQPPNILPFLKIVEEDEEIDRERERVLVLLTFELRMFF